MDSVMMKPGIHYSHLQRKGIIRNANIALGRDVDVWICMSCGQAFPSDNRELAVSDPSTGNLFHATCRESSTRNRGHCKHVGMMGSRAAAALCGPRFQRRDEPPAAAPVQADQPSRFSATVGDRLRAAAKPTPVLAVVPEPAAVPSDQTCISCGEVLVDGRCPQNTPGWPHITGAER